MNFYNKSSWWPRAAMAKILLVMKLTVLLLTTAILQVSAATYGQNVTLKLKNTLLVNVFTEIRKQTGYDFFYSDQTMSGSKSINVDFRNLSLENALNKIFEDQPLQYALSGKMVIVTQKAPSFLHVTPGMFTKIVVNGVVRDAEGNNLVGATIRVKGTDRQTRTVPDGSFSIGNIDEHAILIISYLGYETREVKASRDLGIIVMVVNTGRLKEIDIVSTGYQNLLKERAPGSFGQINQDVLSNRPVSNISTALQGMVAGLQGKENADGSVSFLIRGNSSLYADRNPLVVVDGFPVANSDFSTINPNDVENVTVLKDAAAASIWGARSANGVIVITTKKGNRMKSSLQIEGNVFTRISKLTDLDQLIPMASSAQQVDFERLAFKNHWIGTSEYSDAFPTDLGRPLTLAQELLYGNKAGRITTANMNKSLDSLSGINNHSQLSDLLLQRAILKQYNVSFSQTSDRARSYASLLFEDNQTRFQGTDNKRYGMNFSNEYRIAKWINFNFGVYLQYSKNKNSGASISELSDLSPYESLLNPDGSYAAEISANQTGKNRYILSQLPLSKFPYPDWSYNLLREVRGRDLSAENLNARIQTGLNINILPGLTFDTRYQYERGKNDVKNYYSDETFYVRNLVNTYLEYNNNTKTIGRVFLPKGGIEQSSTNDAISYVFRNQLNFIKDLGKHSINMIAGMEMSQYRTNSRTNPWLYGYFPDKLQSTVPIYGYGSSSDVFTTITGGSGGPGGGSATLSGGNTTLGYGLNRYFSYYGNGSYTYDKRYTISGSVRSDASNFITKIASLRWAPLWSVGVLWNIKNEEFASQLKWIDHLAFRATYGKNGNVEKSTSTNTLIGVSTSPSTTTGTIIASISDNGNPTLRWEKTTTTNLGVDFSIFKNKLFGKIDVYNKVGTDITGVVALSAVTGTTSQKFNNAGITNKGIEIELGTQVTIPGTQITYNTTLNYAYNKNTVNNLYYPAPYAGQMLDPSSTYTQGKPVNPVYSFGYLGTINGVPQVAGPNNTPYSMNNTTLYNGLGLQFLNYEGTAIPPHTAGWYNTIGYKNFNVSVLFIGKFGGVYRNNTFNYSSAVVGNVKTKVNQFLSDVFANRADIPPFANPNETQLYLWDRYVPYLAGLVESSSYIECKEVMLGYTLPKSLLHTAKIRNVKVYAQLRDLGLVWAANKNNYNPDWLPGSNRPLSTYTFGLNLSF